MKKILFLIMVILFVNGCTIFTVPYRIKKDFTYCFNGEKTGLDTLINIYGYYAPDTVIRKSNDILPKDTLRPAYVFYDNGFVTYNTNIDEFIKNETISFLMKRWGGNPGRYILHGDTIKLQYVDGPGGMSRGMGEIWFKIIDRNTIQIIPQYPPLDPIVERVFVFRPLEIKVKPEDTWIYNRRWFRCRKK